MNTDEPEKFIRTFAGDMDMVKKGGTPDLAPFVKAPTPEERLVAPSPLEAVKGTGPQTPPAPVPQTPAYVPPVNTPIQTYSGDFTERMQETKASTATVLAAEQDAAPHTPKTAPQESSHNMLYIIAGVLLLIAGSAGAYFAYTRYQEASAPVVLAPSVSAPIFVDDREEVSVSGSALFLAIKQSISQPLALGAVRLLSFASTTAFGSVFSALGTSAPDILLRNVQAEGSMAGVIHTGSGQSPFFILSVSSYSNTFSGMLLWETTMLRDLAELFPAYPTAVLDSVATSTTATTTVKKTATSTSPVAPFVSTFRDESVSNHDVRVYRDALGQSILLYGYWNQTILVIARDEAAFTEILERLATSRTL